MNKITKDIKNEKLIDENFSFSNLLDEFSDCADSIEDDIHFLLNIAGNIQDRGYETEQENVKLKKEIEILRENFRNRRIGKRQ